MKTIEWSHISIPTIIIGEYYFPESVGTYPWPQLPRQLVFLPSYCTIGRKRQLPLHQLASLDYVKGSDTVNVYPSGHSVNIIETNNYMNRVVGSVEVRKNVFVHIGILMRMCRI